MVGGVLLDRPCMVFQSVCVCVCDPSVCLDSTSIGFVYVYCMSEFISSF